MRALDNRQSARAARGSSPNRKERALPTVATAILSTQRCGNRTKNPTKRTLRHAPRRPTLLQNFLFCWTRRILRLFFSINSKSQVEANQKEKKVLVWEREGRRQCCFRCDTGALPSLLLNIPDDLIWQPCCHGNRPKLSDYCRGYRSESVRPLSIAAIVWSLSLAFYTFCKTETCFTKEKKSTRR